MVENMSSQNMKIQQKMGTENLQNGVPPPKKGAKCRQDGAWTAKELKNNIDPTKKNGTSSGADFQAKKWPTRPQLGPQSGAKMANKSIPKSIIFLMFLGIDFQWDFGGLLAPR